MLSVQPKLRAESVKTILQNTASPFPTGTVRPCTTSTCGAGIVNALQAVSAAKSVEGGGVFHSLAVLPDGSVSTWGYNGNGQLGDGESFGVIRAFPSRIPSLTDIRDAAAGGYHAVAARRDGTVMTWGYNGVGQLGNGTNSDSGVPMSVAGLTNVIAVAAGDYHTLALKADGTVFAWGYNFFGQLGPGPFDFTDRWTPVQVSGLTDIVAIGAGGKRSLALRRDGLVFAWGDVSNVSPDGRSASVSSVPIQVQGLADVVGIAAGGSGDTGSNVDVSMALTWDGKLYTWGYNGFGQLGTGNFTDSFVPQLVSGLTAPVVSFTTGGFHALALLDNGTLWGWGDNSSGELGDGTATSHSSPVAVGSGLSKTIELIAGRVHSFAFLGDFSLLAWGGNGGGQLGDGTQTTRVSPVPVVGF
jgi:alpha-tubulin suppressor-like RCC1 family protein